MTCSNGEDAHDRYAQNLPEAKSVWLPEAQWERDGFRAGDLIVF